MMEQKRFLQTQMVSPCMFKLFLTNEMYITFLWSPSKGCIDKGWMVVGLGWLDRAV